MMKSLFFFFASVSILLGQNRKHLNPFQWDNPLPAKFEKLGVRHGNYQSEMNQVKVGYHILLPAAYEDVKDRKYPVVYLLHGGRPGSESKLLNMVPFILKAQEEKLIPPTIYVFVNGGPVSHYDYPTRLKHLGPEMGTKGNSTFIKELIPHIDETYRTIAEREGRFLEGYSQGGRGTLRTVFRNPELFSAASAGSAGVATELKIQGAQGVENDAVKFSPGDDAYTLAQQYAQAKMREYPISLMLYTGNSKKDFNWEGNVAYSKYLNSLGVKHEHLLIPGCGHSTKQAYEISANQLFGFLSPHLRGEVVIHRTGEADCHTFRIPGIARTNDGTLLAVYDMRYKSRRDLQGHMDIGLSRSTDGGKTWSAPRAIMDMGEYGGLGQDQNGCSDPCILVDSKTGEIVVMALWVHAKPGTHQWVGKGSEPGIEIGKTAQFMIVRSNDDGVTWSEPENWTERLKDPKWYLFAPAPGNGIAMKDGTLVVPTQGRDDKGFPFSNLMWSQDHGKTWTVSNHARDNTTECSVAELSDGSLMLNIRDNRNRKDRSETNGRAVSVTQDLGKTWEVHSTDHGALPEPVCMASLIGHTLKDGRRVLFFSNPKSKTKRERMTVRLSLDDGKTWPKEILLDEKGGAYSSLVMIDDETLGILFESSRADLVFQRLPLSEFGLVLE